MKTLYIDTHSNQIEIILFSDDEYFLEVASDQSNQHSSVIMPTIEKLLKQHKVSLDQIDDIIVINGPGSFTGVRLGVTIAKTLAYTLSIPIRVMSSILIKAISNVEKGRHWFVEDERNGYYVGEFNALDELLNDYLYIKKTDYETFKLKHEVIENVSLDYHKIYDYSRKLLAVPPHSVKPLYVKLIEVQK